MDIHALSKTVHNGLLQKGLEEDLCWIIPYVPQWPSWSRDWTELNWACWICLGRSAFDDLRLLSIIFGGLLVSPLWVPFETAVLVVWGWRWGVGNSTSCQQHWVISGWWRRGADRLAHCHDKAVCTWLNVTEWCTSWFNWFKLSWICHFDWLAD